MQVEFDFNQDQNIPTNPQVKHMEHGKLFRFVGNKRGYYIRVKPTGFLLNSTLIGEVLNRGDVFIVSVESGTVYSVPGDKEVIEVNGSVVIKG